MSARHRVEMALDRYKVRQHYKSCTRGKQSLYCVFAGGKQITDPTDHAQAQKFSRVLTVEAVLKAVQP